MVVAHQASSQRGQVYERESKQKDMPFKLLLCEYKGFHSNLKWELSPGKGKTVVYRSLVCEGV